MIICIPTGKVYVGSAVWITKRWRYHREALRAQKHENPYLQRAWNKYGETAFRFTVWKYVPPERLIDEEQRAIDFFQAANRSKGYNICPNAASPLGRTYGTEFRRKISDARRGKSLSAETKAKISEAMRGNKHLLGHRHSPETIEKLKRIREGKKPALGMRHTEATKAVISARFKGKPLSEEHKQKIAISLKGKPKTIEHRKRLSESQAMFNTDQIDAIRKLHAEGISMRRLAEMFGCCTQTICNVVNGGKAAYRYGT